MSAKQSSRVSTRTTPLRGVTTLVVSSDGVTADAASALLSAEGGDVRVVRTAEEALATLTQVAADVVVVDLVLPQMSGLVLVRQIKTTTPARDVVVVGLSPFDSSLVEAMAAEAGCSACVNKPVDWPAFKAAVVRLAGGLLERKVAAGTTPAAPACEETQASSS